MDSKTDVHKKIALFQVPAAGGCREMNRDFPKVSLQSERHNED